MNGDSIAIHRTYMNLLESEDMMLKKKYNNNNLAGMYTTCSFK